jgi:hypothetical protein
VTPLLQKLLEVSGPAFASASAAPSFDKSLGALLAKKNGFFAFESALRVFPSRTVSSSWGLDDWNSQTLWKEEYGGLADGLNCFAEDIFGVQFCFAEREIWKFDPETGELERLAADLDEWASKILLDYRGLTGFQISHNWQKAHGPLEARNRLMPKVPFVLGGKYELDNLVAISSERLMRNMGNLAHQISSLPDGSTIKFKIT